MSDSHLHAFLAEDAKRRPAPSSQVRATAALKSFFRSRGPRSNVSPLEKAPSTDLLGVDRVARGHYVMRPFGALGTRAAAEDITLAVGAVFSGKPHRIAFRSALDWHGLLEHPSRRIVLAADKRPGLRELSGRPLKVVLERHDRIEIGAIDAGHGARVSSLERVLVESATRPALAGSIQVVASALARARANPDALEEIARVLGARSALHRLGSIAETLEIQPFADRLEPLSSIGRPIPLDPELADAVDGWRDDKWGVDWPFPAEELKEMVRR